MAPAVLPCLSCWQTGVGTSQSQAMSTSNVGRGLPRMAPSWQSLLDEFLGTFPSRALSARVVGVLGCRCEPAGCSGSAPAAGLQAVVWGQQLMCILCLLCNAGIIHTYIIPGLVVLSLFFLICVLACLCRRNQRNAKGKAEPGLHHRLQWELASAVS